jgi:hypothetical protein
MVLLPDGGLYMKERDEDLIASYPVPESVSVPVSEYAS